MQQTIAAGQFKAHCLRLLDEVQQSGQELVITKRGKPVARVAPITGERPTLFGYMRGTGRITGDIIAPIGEVWDAER